MEKGFTDIQSYTAAMAKEVVLQDKLFFLKELPKDMEITTVVDFGCADGSLLYVLQKVWPYAHFIGYDKSETLLQLAKSKTQDSPQDQRRFMFTSDWNKVLASIPHHGKSLLILSSVIHEVYSYAENPSEISDFWHRVFNTGFDYISIRDMSISNSSMVQVDHFDLEKVLAVAKRSMVQDFGKRQAHLGSRCSQKDLIHFLIKSKWEINWDREVCENYFPIFFEDLLKLISESPYHIDYLKRFCPLKDDVKLRFAVDLTENTHIKLILSRKSQ